MNKQRMSTIVTFALVAALGLAGPASAAGCISGGDGSAGVPYVICNENDFTVLQSASSGHFVLGADIDLRGITWAGNTNFDGTLDGAGHSVSNLSIQSNGTTQVNGLFDDLGTNSVIKNIRFVNAYLNVVSRSYAGILAYGIYGLVDNVQVEGTVVTDSGYTGGLAGQLNGGTISNTIVNLDITDTANSYVGGFVGTVSGTPGASIGSIQNSMFIGSMTGGWQSPISLEGMPWWDPFSGPPNPPMSTCDYASSTYFLTTSTQDNRGCGSAISPADLKLVSATTPGFTSWDQSKWFFAQGSHFPQLKLFVVAPSQVLLPTAKAGPANLSLEWLPPIGDWVDGFDVQVRTANTDWSTASTTATAAGLKIEGLANGTAYWVRIRAYNAVGQGAWNYVATAIVPIDVPSLVKVLSAKSKKAKVTLSWKKPASENGSPVANYTVGIFKTAKASKPFKLVATKGKLTAVVTGLKPGTTVWVAVKAQNGAGSNAFGSKKKIKVVK